MLFLLSFFSMVLSSFLLFSIQPLAAKELLPLFGGGPSVWTICMVFFQGILLLGYLKIYLITRYLTRFYQYVILYLILGASLCVLPIAWHDIVPSTINSPVLNVLVVLLTRLALPLLVLSATAPLMQYLFSQSNHNHAKDPYFLYSASNTGSLMALIGFPLLLEPFFGLQQLSEGWSFLYVVLLTLLMTLGLKKRDQITVAVNRREEKISINTRLDWLMLSFAPASLLMAVTQHISMDVAAAPLLWVLPLSLYLITFIIAFSRHPIINHDWLVKNQIYFLIFPLICLGQVSIGLPIWPLIIFHLIGFFALVLACHGKLVIARPSKEYLTEFYLWIAGGGFLGGLFNGIIAPHLFNGIYEYYIAFCLCVFISQKAVVKSGKLKIFLPFVIVILLATNYYFSPIYMQCWFYKWIDFGVWITVITLVVIWNQNRHLLTVNLIIIFCFAQNYPGFSKHDLIWQSRNFFGLTRVYKNTEMNLHFLMSGTTLHGLQLVNQSVDFNRRTSYYNPLQSVSNLLFKNNVPIKVGIAGLGAGNLSCQFRKNDMVTFFEIDPTIVNIAENPKFFTYLKNCPPHNIVIADARIGIAASPLHYFDAIIIDVYSSDAIPTHLFTLDAVRMYLDKLTQDGVLIFNVSSRHINFKPVLLSIAKKLHLNALYFQAKSYQNLQMPSEWVILTKNQKITQELKIISNWKTLSSQQDILWTDDFSNIVPVFKMFTKNS